MLGPFPLVKQTSESSTRGFVQRLSDIDLEFCLNILNPFYAPFQKSDHLVKPLRIPKKQRPMFGLSGLNSDWYPFHPYPILDILVHCRTSLFSLLQFQFWYLSMFGRSYDCGGMMGFHTGLVAELRVRSLRGFWRHIIVVSGWLYPQKWKSVGQIWGFQTHILKIFKGPLKKIYNTLW